MRIRARHYSTGQVVDIICDGGQIVSIGPPGAAPVDFGADYVAPALFDVQINGAHGHGFSSDRLTVDGVRHIVHNCRAHGICELFPAIITSSFEAMAHGLSLVREARDLDRTLAKAIPGIHLEGPYISAEDGPRGAHPSQHVRPPDWQEFCRLQDEANGLIRLVTLAPEHDNALRFIEQLVQAGVVVAIGHTAANAQQIHDAVSAGARLSTHLGNGCHAVLPRHDNYVWEQLANDNLWASLICDGHHLPPAVVKCMVRVKTPARTILTSDVSSLAGLPSGIYREWDHELEVLEEGKIIVPGTPYLAGSAVFTDQCIDNVIRFTGVSLKDALDMAGARPRELVGLPPRRLEQGDPAELILLDWQEGGVLCLKYVS